MATISPKEREPITLDFRAPPPSPIGSRRSSSVTNAEILSEFLEHTLRVPDLILPNQIFPKQRTLREIPAVDFQARNLTGDSSVSKITEFLAEFGCFQVINHGISPELIRSAVKRAGRIFRISPEKKRAAAVRLPEIPFGFEEVSRDQEEVISEMNEEFVWGRSDEFKLKMEGIWPTKYSNFSEKMEMLGLAIEKVAKEIMLILNIDENYPNTPNYEAQQYLCGSILCNIHKHPHGVPLDGCISSLRYDVIRMMISGSDYSHAFSLHICDGSSEFHVYSKKGWVSFIPLQNALIFTVGDQLQAWSGGLYKHVIGRPIYTSKKKDHVSMAFLYSPPRADVEFHHDKKERIISLREQALFAIFFTIVCQFMLHVYDKFSHP